MKVIIPARFASSRLPGKPLRLFKDCLGEIHIFTRNKSYQLYFEEQKLTLYPAIEIDSFMDIMQYCQLLKPEIRTNWVFAVKPNANAS